MKPETIRSVVQLAEKLGHVFVATADAGGNPHVATAGELVYDFGSHVSISAWFCPGTLANLNHNRRIALVVWDAADDHGFQMLGEVEQIEEQAVMNGFDPEIEVPAPLPQTDHRLRVRVDKVIRFSRAPHSDIED